VETFLRETFLQKTRDDWVEWLAKLDVCFGAVKTLPEALQDEQLLARGMVHTDEFGRRHLASPIRFEAEPARINYHEPELDANRAELLQRPPRA
jgi:crotonobetainyl-CoA:carnitine CoA-transferase CaiB-like acyl-CoA transferase